MNAKASREYDNKILKVFVGIATCMSAVVLVCGLMYISSYSNQYHLQAASAIKDKNSTTSTTNTIQLLTKELKP